MSLLFAANWKMNFLSKDLKNYFQIFAEKFVAAENSVDTVFAPPFVLLKDADNLISKIKGIELAAQNAHWLESGAHTGEISCSMLKDCGATYAILGHSERRQFYGETSAAVAKRAKAVVTNEMKAIVCIGEQDYKEDGSNTEEILQQLRESVSGLSTDEANKVIIAYEPVWAIGTGRAATPEIVNRIHNILREELIKLWGEVGGQTIILYGGSTTADNIAELTALKNVGGALVGGTSLKPDLFNQLIINGRKGKNLA
ncbi:MAG: triose-phosphate isomerase [Proteobacteria bacterium]|nr:triose-phosphate isomerase [Pseudomonadota bacterium]